MNKKWINFIAFFVVFIMNIVAAMGKINNASPGRISDEYPLTFTPAGYAFSIWSLIYILLLIFFIWSVSDTHKFSKAAVHHSYTFLVSCLFNIGWIFAWHYRVVWLSWIFIVGLLISLVILNQEIIKSSTTVKSFVDRCLEIYSFQIYYGWIIVATIANTAILLYKSLGNKSVFLGISGELWTVILIIIAFLITWFISFIKNTKPVGLVFIWAVLAIGVKNYQWKTASADLTQFAGKGNLLIVIIAWITALVMLKSYMNTFAFLYQQKESLDKTEIPMKKKKKHA